MNEKIFCNKHNEERRYSAKFKKYECRSCKNEYAALYREKNSVLIKEKYRLYNIKTRERRQEWIKKDRIENPEKYIKYAKKGYVKNSEEMSIRKIIRKYKTTLEHYKYLLERSENKCEICGEKETRKTGKSPRTTRLSLDHCHILNKVRGLLCHTCNVGIGNFKDNINIMKKAINYLESHQHIETTMDGSKLENQHE